MPPATILGLLARAGLRLALLSALLAGAPARADGLADLRAALARLPGRTPLRAALAMRTLERRGEGRQLDEEAGEAAVQLEDGPAGLGLTLARDVLARGADESRAAGRDAQARTPTLWALARLDDARLSALASAAPALERLLEESRFEGEHAEAWQGRPARALRFALTANLLPQPQRHYAQHVDGTLEIWIADDGTPLASALRQSFSGRVFVLVGFDGRDDEDCTYGVAGDRLVTLRRETRISSHGAGTQGEQQVTATLRPLP
jgi:hypothetical protein